jgi:hypothetical protein
VLPSNGNLASKSKNLRMLGKYPQVCPISVPSNFYISELREITLRQNIPLDRPDNIPLARSVAAV